MGSEHWQLCSELCACVLGRALDLPALQGEAAPRCQGEAWEMPWAPGAGQFVVHPVTWGVQAWARLSTEQRLQEVLSCLSFRRAGTALAPGRARLPSLHSWEKEIRVYSISWEVEAWPPRSVLHCCSAGLPAASPRSGRSSPCIWGWSTRGCASLHSPNAETVGLLGHGFILSCFHSLSYLCFLPAPFLISLPLYFLSFPGPCSVLIRTSYFALLSQKTS